MIKSPLNYTGGKHKLLPQLLPLFPSEIDTFYDLFGGGFNVGINVKAEKHIYNDKMGQVTEMLEYFYVTDLEILLEHIDLLIKAYNLSKLNKEGYLELRKKYNSEPNPLMLYTLICHSFNNQIRFNSKGEYNMPFGLNRSSFNPTLKKRFIKFVTELKKLNVNFISLDFRKFQGFERNDFVYCDPPYLLSTATYNEQSGWTEKDEQALLDFLSESDNQGVRFALSNVLETKGNVNKILKNWARNFNIHVIDQSYRHSSYQRKSTSPDLEVLITNY